MNQSLTTTATFLDKDPNYFHFLKSQNYKKFQYISSFDKNFQKSVMKYILHVEELKLYSCSLVYEYENNKEKLKEILVKSKAYKDNDMAIINFEKPIFSYTEDFLSISLQLVQKWKT